MLVSNHFKGIHVQLIAQAITTLDGEMKKAQYFPWPMTSFDALMVELLKAPIADTSMH
jgi:hypothetical protein